MTEAPLTPSKPDSELDLPEFTFSELVRAAKLPSGTVKMWIERSLLKLGTFDIQSQGKGSARMFTLRTLYLAATMAEITRLGVSPSAAAVWAEFMWRDPLSGIPIPYKDMVFIGNPFNLTAHICRRSEITAEAIFRETHWAEDKADLSAVIVDASAVARRCRLDLGLPEQIGPG